MVVIGRSLAKCCSSLLLLILVLSPAGFAGEAAEVLIAEEAQEEELRGGDPLGRSTPRGTVRQYLRAVDNNDWEEASEYLDLRNLPSRLDEYTPEQLARGLAIVLQRSTWIDLEDLSTDKAGHSDDGLPDYRDLLVELQTKQKSVAVLLQRVPDGAGGRIWKFSNATIAQLELLYDEYRYNAFVEWLAFTLPDTTILTISLFKWVTVLISVLIAAPVLWGLGWWLSRLMVSPERELHLALRRFLTGPVLVFLLALLGNQIMQNLGTGITAQYLARGYTLVTAVAIWMLWQGVSLTREAYAIRLRALSRESSIPLLQPLATALKLTVLLLGVLVWLDNLGYQITAVLTGLGIGGIAVALVLQKPLEDVFGAITLYTQQPIKIGDFGRFGTTTGTVEEISLRTTRIRTLGNSLVSVPNMRLATEPIENLSAREKFLFQPVLRLAPDVEIDSLKSLLEDIRGLLGNHKQVLEQGMRVRFTAITLVSFEISVFVYLDARDYADYLALSEELNFGILQLINDSDASLASPMGELLEGSGRA